MKKPLLSITTVGILMALGLPQHGHAQNTGIGVINPGTTLDVAGAITARETSLAVASNAASIPVNTSQVQLTGAATATVTVTAPAAPNAGQQLIIYNNTTGGFGAALNGVAVANGQSLTFTYTNGAWRSTDNGATANPAATLYTADGTLSGARTVTTGANKLSFVNGTKSITLDVASSNDALLQLKSNSGSNWARIGTTGLPLAIITGGTQATDATTVGGIALFVGTSNKVGIGNITAPVTTLDVNGGLMLRETTGAVAANAITIGGNSSQFRITGAATGTIAVTPPAPPNAGQILTVYNNTTGGYAATLNGYTIQNSQAATFVYSNSGWRMNDNGATSIGSPADWHNTGNAGLTDNTNNYIGTTDNVPLNFKVNNSKAGRIDPALGNVFFGVGSGANNTSGNQNTSIGSGALQHNLTGNGNVVIGYSALFAAKSDNNSAVGDYSLTAVTTGSGNTALGYGSGGGITTGSNNIVIGNNAQASSPGVSNEITIGNSSNTDFRTYGNLYPANDTSYTLGTPTNQFSTLYAGTSVGIGLDVAPAYPLSFASTLGDKISLWGSNADHYGFGVQNGLLQIHADGSGSDIAFGYGSSAALTENVRFKANGRVGIGTSSPGELLTVGNAANSSPYAIAVSNAVGNGRMGIASTGGNYGAPAAGDFMINNTAAGKGVGISVFNGSSTITPVYIASSGNTGIGTTIPNAKLDVAGSLKAQSWAAQSSSANGYANMGGVLLQWGTINYISNGPLVVTFPTPFSNVFSITATVYDTNGGAPGANIPCKVGTATNTGFTVSGTQAFSGDVTTKVKWMAIGN